MSVRHDAGASRFVSPTADGGEAYLAYRTRGDTLDIQHTIVPRDAQGDGVGGALVEAAVAYARAHHLRVIPSCAFADAWFERHPESEDLLASPGEADAAD